MATGTQTGTEFGQATGSVKQKLTADRYAAGETDFVVHVDFNNWPKFLASIHTTTTGTK